MTQTFIVDFAMESMKTTLLLSAPMLGFGLVTGLTVSIFSGGDLYSGIDLDLHSQDSCGIFWQ